MARYVLPIAGAIVGSYFGSPQLGFAIGSMLGNIVDPQVIKGPSIGDGQTTTTSEGQVRPIVWGSGVVGANVIDRGELKKSTKRTRQSKGGPVTEEERLHLTYAMRICEGPIQGILRIWENDKLVYDIRAEGAQVSAEDNGEYAKSFRLYTGDEDQMPDSALEAIHGVGNTPAYRGTAYIVYENKDVTDTRGAIGAYRFEVIAGGGAFSTTGKYIFRQLRAAETDDGFDFTVNPETLTWGSNTNRRSVVTRDSKFILAGGSSYAAGNLYKMSEETGEYERQGNFLETIQDWPTDPLQNGLDYLFDIDVDGDTIVAFLPQTNVFGLHTLFVIKYDAETGVFRLTDMRDDVPFNSGAVSCIALDPFGHWVVIGSRNPIGMQRYFITDAGLIFDYQFVSLAPLPSNAPTHLLIPHGMYTPAAYTVIAVHDSQWVAHCYIGPTADSVPVITTRDLATDFPGIDFTSNTSHLMHPYYSESDNGWPKVVLMGNQDYTIGGAPKNWVLCSYEIRGSIPTPPLQSLFPTVELVGADGSGYLVTNTGGYGKDLTAVSGRGTYAPSDAAAGMLRFYKFVHDNETDTFYLDKTQDFSQSYNSDQAGYLQVPLDQSSGISGDGISYQWFVEDVCDRSGLSLNKVDAGELGEYLIRGIVAGQPYNGGEVIRSTQPVFPIDVSDYDKKLHFTKRGKPAVAAIPLDKMVDDTYNFTRMDALSYPRKLNLTYQHQKSGYVSAKATVERISPDVRVSGESSTSVPVVMDETQATRAADILLKASWTDAEGDVEFSVLGEYDYLTVGDCVGVYPRSGQQYRMRIESIERADGILKIKGKIDRQSSYFSQITALPVPDPTPPPPTFTGPTRLAYMDTPAFTDADDLLCYYVAMNGNSPAWYGGVADRRIGSDEFAQVASTGLGQAVGLLLEELGAGPVDYTDTYNTILIAIPGGEMNAPLSVSDEQLLREKNVLAVCRPDGSAEILQFRDVEDLGDNQYRLSHLIRGRLYTGSSTHSEGALVVLLDYGVSRVVVDSSLLGATWDHRGVSYGQDPDLAPVRTDTYAARSQTEFPVGLLAAEVSGTDLLVSWSHAFRFGSDVTPVDSVNRTGYQVDATDGVNTATLTTLPGDQTATLDITGWTGTVTVSVRGVNRYTGPGTPSTTTATI